ncbi:MAG: carboxypeptidase-like regulatory domain-containing protein, partial [Ginsengibacter sp.]
MKLTIVLLITFCLQVSAKSFSQKITLNADNISVQKVFEEIRKQTGYRFLYADEVINTAKKVSINIQQGSIQDVLDFCFKDQQLNYIISGNIIIVQRKILAPKVNTSLASPSALYSPAFINAGNEFIDANEIRAKIINNAVQIKGRVTNSNGEPLIGVSITVKETTIGTSTDSKGMYSVTVPDENRTLVFSYVGFTTKEFLVSGRSEIDVIMEESISSLEQVVVGYGVEKKVNLTGSVSTINFESKEIESRPLLNVSTALSGLAAGVFVNQNNGAPQNNAATIKIRGTGTLNAGANALVIIDGTPGDMNIINPNDIASISILKDASSAAIYGSRASNGVILITTKSGSSNGKVVFDYNGYVGRTTH